MRLLPAIILLLWTVCYGRCLAEQYGGLEAAVVHCCSECETPDEDGKEPVDSPMPDCGVCEFIQAGGTPLSVSLTLDTPVWVSLESFYIPEFVLNVVLSAAEMDRVAADTGPPPRLLRMCEWMARTAAPVRGPDALA